MQQEDGSAFLDSNKVLNAEAAERFVDQVSDKREKALLRFLTAQTIYAMQLEDAKPPDAPIDMLYVMQIGRKMYQSKRFFDQILHGDVDDFLWGEE